MADAARALYDSLTDPQAMMALVGRVEDLHFEAKRCPSFDKRAKGYVSQALSGFANSDGGVLVLGLSTEHAGDEPDVVTRTEPFEHFLKVASEIQLLMGDAVDPPVDGVLVEAVPADRAGYGYVKLLVPASDGGPHRAQIREIGAHLYWKRSGGRFYEMEHYDLADMFGRRRRPDLHLDWRALPGSKSGEQHNWLLLLILTNLGRGLARFPSVEIEMPPGLNVYKYGVDDSGNHGLPWRALPGVPRRHAFVGSQGDVVHPGLPLELTRIMGMSLHTNPDGPWRFSPEIIKFPYKVAAEDMPVRERTLTIDIEAELSRVKKGIGLA